MVEIVKMGVGSLLMRMVTMMGGSDLVTTIGWLAIFVAVPVTFNSIHYFLIFSRSVYCCPIRIMCYFKLSKLVISTTLSLPLLILSQT